MSESAPLNDERNLHEGTQALHEIAQEVERERAERGRSSVDGAPVSTAEDVDAADAGETSEETEHWEDDAQLGVPGTPNQMPH